MTELGSQGAYSRHLLSHAKQIPGDEVEVHVRELKRGSYHGHVLTKSLENAFVYDRILVQLINASVAVTQKMVCPTLNLWQPAAQKG